MYWRTKKMTMTIALVNAMLDALNNVPGGELLDTPLVGLYKTGATPTPGMAFADFTAADFTGYAAVPLVTAGPVVVGGTDRALVASAVFIATAVGVDPALGYYIYKAAGPVYMAEPFTTPMSFGAVGAFLDLDLIIPLPAVYTPTII